MLAGAFRLNSVNPFQVVPSSLGSGIPDRVDLALCVRLFLPSESFPGQGSSNRGEYFFLGRSMYWTSVHHVMFDND